MVHGYLAMHAMNDFEIGVRLAQVIQESQRYRRLISECRVSKFNRSLPAIVSWYFLQSAVWRILHRPTDPFDTPLR